MISRITGILAEVDEGVAQLQVGPILYEVRIPEFTRRQIQLLVGTTLNLFTIDYIDGNAAKGGRLTPRLIGFSSQVEREFFEVFCSVDGVGVKTALRAMVRPVPDVARAIEDQDVKSLATLPGIGPATAERIVAKLRRKMARFALFITPRGAESPPVEGDVAEETRQILINLGHAESDARKLIDDCLARGRRFKSVEELLQAAYDQTHRR